MQAKKVKDLRPKSGGDVDKTQTIETVAKDMRTGKEISRSAATYTTGTKKESRNAASSALKAGANQARQGLATAVRNDNPAGGYKMAQGANTAKAAATGAAAAQNLADQLKSKQYELSQNKSGTQKGARAMSTKKAMSRG